mmetsp:Transcript_2203/g.6236  ORF Transcript_2203/g.6236 Transcript_2203/m.6236 type:complete len:242 (-) Transcript_2203:22-747(-)
MAKEFCTTVMLASIHVLMVHEACSLYQPGHPLAIVLDTKNIQASRLGFTNVAGQCRNSRRSKPAMAYMVDPSNVVVTTVPSRGGGTHFSLCKFSPIICHANMMSKPNAVPPLCRASASATTCPARRTRTNSVSTRPPPQNGAEGRAPEAAMRRPDVHPSGCTGRSPSLRPVAPRTAKPATQPQAPRANKVESNRLCGVPEPEDTACHGARLGASGPPGAEMAPPREREGCSGLRTGQWTRA